MVIETNVTGIYVHAAYATDDKGTDFSLTSFPEAVYIGNYMDRSATESTDPNMYKWKPLYSDNVSPADIEDDSEAYESVDVADVQANVDSLEGATSDLKVRTDYNEDNLEKTQSTQDEGLGNLNLLVGTNQGDSNWTAGSATIASVTDPVYSDDPNDEIDTVQFTLTSATDTFTFDSGNLLDYIAANDEDENTYTLSYDIKVSNTSATMVPSVPSILTFESPEFTDDPDDDFSDTWLHFASTAVISSTSGTDFQFTYSGSAADTVQIANLKIEAGALATPWRASLAEVESTANTALSTANTAASDAATALAAAQAVNNYFWHDSSGAHVTQVTQTQYQGDPANAGGNTLITSSGLNVLDGTTTLASFGSTGAQIGESASEHATIDSSGFTINDNTQEVLNIVGISSGSMSGGKLQSEDNLIELYEDSQISYTNIDTGGRNKTSRDSYIYLSATGQYGGEHIVTGVFSTQVGQYDFALYHTENNTPTITFGVAASGNGYFEGDLWVNGDTTTDDITASGDITATGDISAANATLTGTMTVGRDPTSNLEVATKKYVDDNSGGGGFAGTATIIKTSATLTSTATDYTLSDSIANYKFLTFVFSNSTNYGRWTVPVSIFNLSTTAMENVVTRGGSTTRYAYIKYVNNTKINAYCSVNNGLNMVVYGIK